MYGSTVKPDYSKPASAMTEMDTVNLHNFFTIWPMSPGSNTTTMSSVVYKHPAHVDYPSGQTDNDTVLDEAVEEEEASWMNMRIWALCLATFYIVITIIGLAANGAVLYIIARSRRSKAVTSIYIFNLAIADLLYLFCLPAAVYPMLNGHWILGHIMCKLYFTCDGVSKFASVMFLVVLSFDRYMAVCHPLGSRTVRTAKVAFAAAGVSWLLVIIAMIPVFFYATLVKVSAGGNSTLQCVIYWHQPVQSHEMTNANNTAPLYTADMMDTDDQTIRMLLENTSVPFDSIISNEIDLNDTGSFSIFFTPETDWQRRIFTLYLFALSFSVPLLMVWIFYIMILHRLWTQKRNLFNASRSIGQNSTFNEHRRTRSERAMLPSNKAIQRRRRSTKRVTIMVLSIVVAYTLCWIPYWCVQMTIEFFREDPALDFEIFTVASYLAYGIQSINSAVNPFLYAFGTHSHRRRLLQWMRRGVYFLTCRYRALQQLMDGNSSSGSTGNKHRSHRMYRRRENMGMTDMANRGRCGIYTPIQEKMIKQKQRSEESFSTCVKGKEGYESNGKPSSSSFCDSTTVQTQNLNGTSKMKETAFGNQNCCGCVTTNGENTSTTTENGKTEIHTL